MQGKSGEHDEMVKARAEQAAAQAAATMAVRRKPPAAMFMQKGLRDALSQAGIAVQRRSGVAGIRLAPTANAIDAGSSTDNHTTKHERGTERSKQAEPSPHSGPGIGSVADPPNEADSSKRIGGKGSQSGGGATARGGRSSSSNAGNSGSGRNRGRGEISRGDESNNHVRERGRRGRGGARGGRGSHLAPGGRQT